MCNKSLSWKRNEKECSIKEVCSRWPANWVGYLDARLPKNCVQWTGLKLKKHEVSRNTEESTFSWKLSDSKGLCVVYVVETRQKRAWSFFQDLFESCQFWGFSQRSFARRLGCSSPTNSGLGILLSLKRWATFALSFGYLSLSPWLGSVAVPSNRTPNALCL